MTTENGDALAYSQQMTAKARQTLMQHGHGACRELDSARYDYANGAVLCGCGHQVVLEGAQTFREEQAPEQPGTALDPVRSTLATIDPTMAYTPVDLEMRILDVLARLELGAVFERKAIEEAAAAELEYKKAYWIAKNASTAGAADKREADARVQTMDLFEVHQQTDLVRKAVAATMHNLRAVLSGYQSVAKSVSADMGAGGSVR